MLHDHQFTNITDKKKEKKKEKNLKELAYMIQTYADLERVETYITT